MRRNIYIIITWITLIIFPFMNFAMGDDFQSLMDIARDEGYVKIIIKLDVANIKLLTEKSTRYKVVTPGARFPSVGIQADLELEQAIQAASFSLLHQLNNMDYRIKHTYSALPYLALEVPAETLALLPSLPEVLEIFHDKPNKLIEFFSETNTAKQRLKPGGKALNRDKPLLNVSTGIIGATTAWNMGYTGSGWYVAILDTGIRRTHQFFTGKTIKEACFSANNDCPNNNTSMYGTGAAAHYESTYYGYDHGTHVAGIAAGKYGSKAGVAKNSNIIAVQVFSRFGIADCGDEPCVMSYDSDQVKGLDYIYSLRSSYSIAAVNMSLGSGAYSSYCNSEPQRTAIDNLKAVRIATVIATGNDGYCGYVSSPSCISTAIAVGASSDSDTEAYFNNWNNTLQELFAPGVSINSSTGDSNSSYESWNGTSMATPHVTGAWALMRQASPTASVDTVFNALTDTGTSISTLCYSGGSCPRIQVDDAIDELLGGGTTPTLTVTDPNGGESWTVGSSHTITWSSTGTVGNVKIEYTANNGTDWSTIVSSTANDGAYTWTIPNTPSSQCKVRIKEASDGSPVDTSNAVFTIASSSGSPTLTVLSPNGGESWEAASNHTISWTSSGTVGKVKIEYTTNNGTDWSTIVSSTDNDGGYTWTVPNTPSTKCKVRIKEVSDGSPADTSNAVFTIIDSSPPEISLSRTQLNFSGISNEIQSITGAQLIWLNNSGGGTLNWSSTTSASWLVCSPVSGASPGVLTISVNSAGLSTGSYTGIVNISDVNATNSPQAIVINLKLINSSQDQVPFGEFATPGNGTTVMSSIPVTGWILDDIEVQNVKIYIDNGYVGDAVFVEGARPDVELAYPGYPKNHQAGWGYMLLTNVLTDGSKSISAKAFDNTGNQVTLGTKTITINNGAATKPFGAMDTPSQGGGASGVKFRNQGWALTPQPNKIPVDGSTIKVYVDGKYLGHATYNIYRADIAGLFPGYANSNGALGYFEFDTTSYENGVHTIQWSATDNGGNSDGIGSRYFTVQNTGSSSRQNRAASRETSDSSFIGKDYRFKRLFSPLSAADSLSRIPMGLSTPVGIKKGYDERLSPQMIYPDDKGTISIEIRELERIEISLNKVNRPNEQLFGCSGYHLVGDQLRPLPVGSVLDFKQNKFFWQPGPGYLGTYELVFITFKGDVPVMKRISVKILPKF